VFKEDMLENVHW